MKNIVFQSEFDYFCTSKLTDEYIMISRETINSIFEQKFHTTEGCLYAAPGRINLIGEHTDYNDGYVFPGAIDKGITAKINPNGTEIVRAYAIDLDEYAEIEINSNIAPEQSWARYIFGVCREMSEKGVTAAGFDTVFSGDIPLGAGMSSSAAFESCYAFAINELFGDSKLSKMELARVGQATEHKHVGVNCGIMDQFASVFGKEGFLIRLDCRSMEYEYFPFNPEKHGYRVVLLDSVVKHQLADSPYNRRRESCERVSEVIGVPSLRYTNSEALEKVKDKITEEDYKRAKYVIEEEQRVLDVCDALKADDYETVGRRMYETHKGLSEEYEVSCEELDFLNELASAQGVSGSRMMGGGFGGCTINLVREEQYEQFIETTRDKFREKFGHFPEVYEVSISEGARKLD